MNLKIIAPLGLAAVFAGAAAFVAKNLITTQPTQAASEESVLRQVVVANANILPGTEIKPDMLITAKVSQEMAPEGTFVEAGELNGRVTQGPIYKGQPIMATLLAPKGSPGGLQSLVPKGMRAITIQIDEFSGVGGFLTPGCRVDILSTMTGDTSGDMVAHAVVQNLMVTAVGNRMTLQKENGQEQPVRSVTLICTPEEAQAVELAASTGRPRLVLRNVRDEAKEQTAGVSLKDLKGDNSPSRLATADPFAITSPVESIPTDVVPVGFAPTTQPTTPSTPRFWTIHVIRGGNQSEVQLPLPEDQKIPQTNNRNEPITKTESGLIGGGN